MNIDYKSLSALPNSRVSFRDGSLKGTDSRGKTMRVWGVELRSSMQQCISDKGLL
jgi:hypothetical protein